MRVRLKGINRVRKRLASGKTETYYYAWKGGPRLKGEPGSPEFHASYNEAVETQKRTPKQDLQSLIDRYLQSRDFLDLADATKRGYKGFLPRIEREFGDLPIATLADRRIRGEFLEWRDRIGAKSPRSADSHFKLLARIISWGFNRGLAPANPCERPGHLYNGTRKNKVWTSEQEAIFLAKAPEQLRLPFLLGLWTGQRKSDLLNLTWSAYDGDCIRLKQRKTGAQVVVPVADVLREALDAAKAKLGKVDPDELDKLPIVTTVYGKGWKTGFSASWTKACQKAGITGVTFHDLRGTLVTRMALAGASIPEIATVTGHSLRDVNDILDAHYMNRDPELARSGIRKLQGKSRHPTELPTED